MKERIFGNCLPSLLWWDVVAVWQGPHVVFVWAYTGQNSGTEEQSEASPACTEIFRLLGAVRSFAGVQDCAS